MFPACMQHHISEVFIFAAFALTSTEFASSATARFSKKKKGRAERLCQMEKAAVFFSVCIIIHQNSNPGPDLDQWDQIGQIGRAFQQTDP